MLGENIAALFLLYARPVAAVSRILDRGRLWFAIVAALAVSLMIHIPQRGAPLDQGDGPAVPAASSGQSTPDPHSKPPPDFDDDNAPVVPPIPRPPAWLIAIVSWIGEEPGGFYSSPAAIALVFIPVIVFARATAGYGSFSVLMRSDYLSLLMCLLMVWAAAYLPAAVILWLTGGQVPLTPLLLASNIYFVVLGALAIRTAQGVSFGPAAGLVALGSLGAMLGLTVSGFAGPSRYYLMSPFLLYYGYTLFASDVRSLGDGLRSRQNLRRQLEISTNNPRDADAHYQLGLIYQKRRQWTEALARFNRAVEIDPKEADPHFQLGRIARAQKRFEDAIGHLKTAASLDDKLSQSDVWRDLGAAYFEAGKTEEAAAALAKFTDRRPYDPEGLYWYGRALAKLGRKDEAREVFERAIEAVKTMPPHRRAEVRVWGSQSKSELKKVA
jgi:tetratricopeptide (TPR) repeat protein